MSKSYDEYSKEPLAESESLRLKHLETIVRREGQLVELEKRIEKLEKQLAFEYQDDDTKITSLKKALEEMTCKGKKLCCELGNAMFEINDLKSVLKEAKKEVEELRYRLRLCGIDNPLPKEKEEKHYKSPLHYCPHGIKITETCVDCGRKADHTEKDKEEADACNEEYRRNGGKI